MRATRSVVVGGGIAGLAVAWALAKRGRDVTLLEAEPALGTHSSARNAQIWLPVDDDETTGPLALRSAEALTSLLGAETEWLVRDGALVLAPDAASAETVRRGAEKGGVKARTVDFHVVARESPVVTERVGVPLWIEGAGIFDPHAMVGALAKAAKAHGVKIRLGARAQAVESDAVRLEGGERVPYDEVVNAAGAWAGELGRARGAHVPLVPLRRHLVLLDADPRAAGTTVWRFGDAQVYWRPESGGVLASPCDEAPVTASLPPADPGALEALAEALEPVAPSLVDAPVRTKWACLRTYAHDRELVLGPDARAPGLSWMAGFGGRGMTVAVAAGELCAKLMDGEDAPIQALVRPDRPQPEALADHTG
ncbi:MAG: FAD-dependent oxidoreductase [Sandaracinaceae bacterium]